MKSVFPDLYPGLGPEQPGYLASEVVTRMPRHLHYVELCPSNLDVLLDRDPDDPRLWLVDKSGKRGVSEVINDFNGTVTNFWHVLRHEDDFARFRHMVEALPPDEQEFLEGTGSMDLTDPVSRAVLLFATCRRSLAGGANVCNGVHPPGWLSVVPGLPAVYSRLVRVLIVNRPPPELVRSQDGPHTLFYCNLSRPHDPELLTRLRQVQGKVMLNGEDSPLYDNVLAGWERHPLGVVESVAGGQVEPRLKRVLWCKL